MRIHAQTIPSLLLALVILLGLAACEKENRQRFDLSQGPAAERLKEFASQAGIEILFDPNQVEGFHTRAVSGNYAPEEALERMLRETPLTFTIDSRTRAYAVIRSGGKEAPGASP